MQRVGDGWKAAYDKFKYFDRYMPIQLAPVNEINEDNEPNQRPALNSDSSVISTLPVSPSSYISQVPDTGLYEMDYRLQTLTGGENLENYGSFFIPSSASATLEISIIPTSASRTPEISIIHDSDIHNNDFDGHYFPSGINLQLTTSPAPVSSTPGRLPISSGSPVVFSIINSISETPSLELTGRNWSDLTGRWVKNTRTILSRTGDLSSQPSSSAKSQSVSNNNKRIQQQVSPQNEKRTTKKVRPAKRRKKEKGDNFCKTCKKEFATVYTLKTHEKIHLGIKNFHCGFCGYRCLQRSALESHIRHRHTKEWPFTCPVENCGASFAHSGSMKRHQLSHNTNDESLQKHQCSLCPYQSARQSNLTQHQKNVHPNFCPFKCPFLRCGYATKFKSALIRHINSKHSN